MPPYTGAWLCTAFIPATLWALLDHSHCLPSASAPRRILCPFLDCAARHLHPMRGVNDYYTSHDIGTLWEFSPFGKREARKHLSAWLFIMLPLPRDVVVISLLHGLGCLSPVWTQVHDGRCSSCCLVAEWPAGTPEIEKSGLPPQVGIADPLLLKSLKQVYQNCESIDTSPLELPSVFCRYWF